VFGKKLVCFRLALELVDVVVKVTGLCEERNTMERSLLQV